jgi:type VI protein secretion system component Hcp
LTDEDLSNVTGGGAVFLKLEGVAGESQDDKHRGEIEVQSFGHK